MFMKQRQAAINRSNAGTFAGKPILAESPSHLRHLGKDQPGLRYLLLNVSYACGNCCSFCWTSQPPSEVRRQTKDDNLKWFTPAIRHSLLKAFKERGGEVVAIMADGEPLFGVNLDFVKTLAAVCKDLDLGMLILTNGANLTGSLIGELGANPRISFAISIKAGSREKFEAITNVPNSYERVMANRKAWLSYDQQSPGFHQRIHRISVHTQISSLLDEQEMMLIRDIVSGLGGVPWYVTSLGNAGNARANPSIIPTENLSSQLISKYHTGPIAMLSRYGRCSYIVSKFHADSIYGLTIHPFNDGSVQSCPYLSAYDSRRWFNLRGFSESSSPNVEAVGQWLDHALLLERMVTSAVFNAVGYEHCLMRHRRIGEIELFLKKLNRTLADKLMETKVSASDGRCLAVLTDSLKNLRT